MSPAGAPYAPFMDPRTARAPGVSPLDPAAWIVCDPDFATQVAERDALVAEKPDLVLAELPEAAAPLEELRAALLAHLAGRPEWTVTPEVVTRPDGAALPQTLPTLPFLARVVQEDLLLLAPGPEEYVLIAGALCFPSRWLLSEKMGRPLTEIHRVVPDYAEGLAARVNRLFAAMTPERPLMRINWGPHPTDALHQPWSKRWNAPELALDRGFWLRTERQTLLRLPRSRAVVFGIKTTVTPFSDLTPEQRAALDALLRERSAEEIAYRGGPTQHAASLAALHVVPHPAGR